MFVYRSLLPFERRVFAEHLLRLSPADRRMRFGCPASDAFIQDYVGRIPVTDVIYAAFDEDLMLRGAAHVAFGEADADLGLSVEEDLRGLGIGTRLLDAALELAQARGARHFTSQCLSHNRWMMGRVRQLGFKVASQHGEATATGELPLPTATLLGGLALKENLSWVSFGWLSLTRAQKDFGVRALALGWPQAAPHP